MGQCSGFGSLSPYILKNSSICSSTVILIESYSALPNNTQLLSWHRLNRYIALICPRLLHILWRPICLLNCPLPPRSYWLRLQTLPPKSLIERLCTMLLYHRLRLLFCLTLYFSKISILYFGIYSSIILALFRYYCPAWCAITPQELLSQCLSIALTQ